MTPHSFDPVTAAITVLATLVGPVLAHYLGAYAVIILAACVGGCWSLTRQEPQGRGRAALFLVLVSGTAVMVTAGLAELANHYVKEGIGNWLLAPIALGVGAVGHEWPAVIRWAAGPIVRRFIDHKANQEPHQ